MSAPALVDDAARRRITTDGLDELLFVEAGAGTGKTKQLVDRVVSLVLHRGIPMREIAAITFTEAAASELRSRIREAFERSVHDATADPADRARGEAALAELDSAAIGTVHSFAQRVLAEHPVEAGLPPNVEVLDEVESLLEFGRRWQEEVDRMFATVELAPIISLARRLDVRIDHDRLPSLREVAAVFADNWDRLEPILDSPVIEPTVIRDVARTAMVGFGPLFARCLEIPDDKLADRILGFRAEIETMQQLLVNGSDRELIRLIAWKRRSKKNWVHRSAGTAANWGSKEEKAAVALQIIDAEAALDNVFNATADAVLRVLAGEVARFTVASAQERRRDGRLEFHDLLVFARQLLREHSGARAALHARYTRLLVDEFQDTDPIQVELATLIAAVVGDYEPGTDWRAIPVVPERLFFVGDPKQSIYRFRRADIELFLTARDRFAGESVRLSTNFRTVAPVLEWVNHAFGELMADEIPGRRPRYEPLAAHRSADDSGRDHRVALLGEPHSKEEGLRAPALRELEAHTVADAVAAILGAPEDWPVEDDEAGWRPARPDDIAILVPTRTSLGGLMDALRDRGVDFRAETGTLVYETQEIRDLLSILRAIAYGTDAVALVAALRSPILGCGDDDLVTYAHAGGQWNLGAERPDLPVDHPVMAALTFLDELRAARWHTSPSALIEWIVRDRHVMTLGLAERRARDGWRRIRFFIDQARLFEASQSADLVAFVGWAELQRSEMARVHEPLLPEADDHAVRIMTIHGAKGLEFPITVVSGLTTKMTARRNRFHVRWDGDEIGLAARSDVATSGFDRLSDLEAEMDGEEKRRLLYVACTRARDHLLIAAHHIEGVESFAGLVWKHSQAAPDTCWRVCTPPAALIVTAGSDASIPIDFDAAARTAWIEQRDTLLAARRRPRTISATALRRVGKVLDWEFIPPAEPEAELAEVDTVAPEWRHGRAATAFGRAVHAVLQDVDLVAAANLDALAAAAAQVEGLSAHQDEIVDAVRSILGAEIVQLAASGGGEAFREMYVAAPVGDRVIEGYIDLLVRTDDGLVIVDYKTDRIENDLALDARVEEYRLQLAAYALAVEVSVGLPVSAGVLVFAGPEGAVERRIPAADLGLDEVRSLLGVTD